MIRRATLIVFVGLMVGCGAARSVEIPAPDLSTSSYALQSGSATVEGSGFLRQRGGDVVSCAGSSVWLVPDTSYFQWASGQDRFTVQEALLNPEVTEYVRTESCDVEGRFSFTQVPNGEYLAGTIVTWEVFDDNPFTDDTQGGIVFVPVSVESDDTQTVTITR